MTQVSGTTAGAIVMQFAKVMPDDPAHTLAMIEVSGVHESDDGHWAGAKLTYWGMADLLAGTGLQTGYFSNQHINGDTTFGSFDGNVTTVGFASRFIGKWQLVKGTGRFEGVSGGGSFEAQSNGPTSMQMTWTGEYTLRSSNDVIVEGPIRGPSTIER
jgi:hypothetical protein